MAHPRGRRTTQSRAGIHLLRSRELVRELVRSSGVGHGDRVFDLGAGRGALTGALAATGASVVAVERDPRFARVLRERFGDRATVRVVQGDLRAIRVARHASVVANIPFGLSEAVIGALLDRGPVRAGGIDLLVEWGFARRMAQPRPRSAWSARRAARYRIELVRPVPRAAFQPPPRVRAAHLRIRPRAPLDRAADERLRAMLALAYSDPGRQAAGTARRVVGRRTAMVGLREAGVDPRAPAGSVEPWVWATIARQA